MTWFLAKVREIIVILLLLLSHRLIIGMTLFSCGKFTDKNEEPVPSMGKSQIYLGCFLQQGPKLFHCVRLIPFNDRLYSCFTVPKPQKPSSKPIYIGAWRIQTPHNRIPLIQDVRFMDVVFSVSGNFKGFNLEDALAPAGTTKTSQTWKSLALALLLYAYA